MMPRILLCLCLLSLPAAAWAQDEATATEAVTEATENRGQPILVNGKVDSAAAAPGTPGQWIDGDQPTAINYKQVVGSIQYPENFPPHIRSGSVWVRYKVDPNGQPYFYEIQRFTHKELANVVRRYVYQLRFDTYEGEKGSYALVPFHLNVPRR